MNRKLLSFYGLKWNPFSPELPDEALHVSAELDRFRWRVEQSLVKDGGFALIVGESGLGKSVALRTIAQRMERIPNLRVGAVAHPQSNLIDFYLELGELFGVALKAGSRWSGFKSLRERWLAHIESSSMRALLLIDEAQEMSVAALNELRLMTSARFDSKLLLSVILCGDRRLLEMLQREELIPLGSRIRLRLPLEALTPAQLREKLDHLLETAGAPMLMSPELKALLCDHALGNCRVLVNIAAELLAHAAQHEITTLDEKLYFDLYRERASKATTKPKSAR
ncbi:MAG: ATP-binding protein [Planctomycetes bacterium]|nr:ATP-binding protein [Candidatus Eisenbacteria bacterium]MBK9387299.1 ATP-binding protein [Planctomycetota bacterium]